MNLKFYDVTAWLTNNCNTHTKQRQSDNEIWSIDRMQHEKYFSWKMMHKYGGKTTILVTIFETFWYLTKFSCHQKLPHELPNDFRLRTLEKIRKYQDLKTLQNYGLVLSVAPKIKILSILAKNSWKIEIELFPLGAISQKTTVCLKYFGQDCSPRPISEKSKLTISLDQKFAFIVSQVEGYRNMSKLSCRPRAFTSN